MGIQQLLVAQGDLSEQISRLLTNYKKSKTRVTKAYIETRLELLESNFISFKKNHLEILELATSDERKDLQYFKEDFYYNCEDDYLELKTLMKEHLEELTAKTEIVTKKCEYESVNAPIKCSLRTKLPAIEIPSFSGNYNEWTSFYDLFKSLIHDNLELSDIQKYHYLKSNLKGEAELLLRQFPLTEANYAKAIELLQARYDNKRLIVHAHITRLLGQKKLPSESAKGIRALLDTTSEVLHALNNVGVSTTNWDPLVTHIIVAKFDSESHRLWEQKLGGSRDLPTIKELQDFMEMRFRTLESLQMTNTKESTANRTPQLRSFKASTEPVCTLCNEDHYIHSCKEFSKLSPEERREVAKEKQLCFNCLIPRHSVRFCRQNTSCKICKRRHHSLLHLNSTETQQSHVVTHVDDDEEEVENDDAAQLAVYKADITGTQVLLATAMIRVRGKDGRKQTLRALIDQGSQASFITTSAAQRLGLHREHVYSRVTGIDSKLSTVSKEVVGFNLYSLYDEKPVLDVKAHVLKTLASILPRKEVNVTCASEIKKLLLADPTFCQPSGIDLLLGAEILMDGVQRYGSVLAQNSHLGWLISGKVDGSHTEMKEVFRFWESEELHTKTRTQTASETQCEKIFEATHSRTDSGRYIVALPFSPENGTPLGESKSLAVKRLLHMERRFQRDEGFQQRYRGFMDEYEDLNHMEKVPVADLNKSDVCYLPHHGVLREESTTTKLRVVFDGSAETSTGASLNEKLLIGPSLKHDIRDIFLRWRRHKICIVADIQRMYRQILVRPEDQDFQRIVWRRSPSDLISEYRLCTVTYGTSCAPYLAIKVLRQLASDERNKYPNAASVLESDFYMDDLLSGCDTELDAIELCKQLICLLERGGFVLHKWGTNSANVLNSLPKEDNQQESFDIIMENSVKALGVKWNPKGDSFELNINFSQDCHKKVTKRIVLSDIAKIYDPLGWLSPVVIVAKIFLQKLWLLGIGWDDELPVHFQTEWASFKNQIHGFSDASNAGYAGVVYVRIIDSSGVVVKILAAKTKVAPVKQVSIPRLELCGAVLTAKLMDRVKTCLNVPDDNVYGWTDSTIVLAWLQKHPNTWKTFVGNRVAEILNVTKSSRWHHVNSADNLADCASRGTSPSQLSDNELWWNGPHWLHSNNELIVNNELHDTDLEFKVSTHTVNIDELTNELYIQRYSNLMKLIRVIAYCLRFVEICKNKIQNKSSELPQYLTSNELKIAMNCCIKMSQNCYFPDEILALQHGQGISKKSPLYFLHPFLDENQLLRVGGRLKNACIPRDTKNPFIISGKSQLAKLIVDQTHKRTLHGGPLLMLNVIRANYWITNVKSLVKLHVRKCLACIRYSPRFATQLMGNLPAARVTISKPFSSSGVDFAGPCYLKSSKLKNAVSIKAYIAIFICTVTKAIHLELVSELSTNAFIAAFKRFTSRRGYCSNLYSDCGTNFVGANFELSRMLNRSKASLPVELRELLASDGTEWSFIPPGSAHFGGLWESGVRSIKHHIRRVIGDTKLTFEEYSTLLAQIECCLNSRPISALSDSVDDYTALTPGHFLMLGPPLVVPHENVIDIPINRLNRWQHIEHMLQCFWKRWTQEYLVTLQNRYKWSSPQHSLKVNDLVIVKNECLPPSKWLLGRVIEVHPGNDGLVRVVTVKCGNSILKRSITKICLLPIET
ncbi:hypothetical protein ABMA27_009420 [Loxostege sticticalis]|uniref:Integrase catalytic domain-containing protein n=1 Tax=Loxostege sticticalis TaxID=481309 RepID=A0ABR3H7W2_LOXSC